MSQNASLALTSWLANGGGLVSILNELPYRLIVKDRDSVFIACNQAFADDLGRAIADIVGHRDADFVPAEIAARYVEADRLVMDSLQPITFEEPFVFAGRDAWLRTVKKPLFGASGEVVGLIVIFEDITEQRRLSRDLHRHGWTLSALHRASEALVRAGDEQELLDGVCAALTHDDEYPLCWIGWAERDEAHTIRIAAAAGKAAGYVAGLRLSWGGGPMGAGPAGTAIRESRVAVDNDAIASDAFTPWRQRAIDHDIAALISVPLCRQGLPVGVLCVYARTADSFGERERDLFQEFTRTLMFGIETRRTAIALSEANRGRDRQERELRLALEEALGAIGGVLEQRDPYTAGHQKHVAELAVAIGREMGLDGETLHALRLAATVHDLGKIEVPVEILTKPAQLSPAEFALVKRHPEVGYQLLKRIAFPWPIADIIRQHHELLDGSGYPFGLKGEQILPAARILTVADIVESISSDRPYRPALGLDHAVAEIGRMRGSKLDPMVVDACLSVLARGEFVPHML